VPTFKGAWMPDLISYVPSFAEWMVSLTGIFLMLTVYALGEKLLNLGDAPTGKG
jgi:uncharacterized protein involved in cysteine biosynthesis